MLYNKEDLRKAFYAASEQVEMKIPLSESDIFDMNEDSISPDYDTNLHYNLGQRNKYENFEDYHKDLLSTESSQRKGKLLSLLKELFPGADEHQIFHAASILNIKY